MARKMIRIANAGGYWGDDPFALRRQIEGSLDIDYISIDYLAEITMSILQKQMQKDPNAGFARDFVTQLEPLLEKIIEKKIKIITNAGGVNPRGCARALCDLAQQKGVALKVAVVEGDNIQSRIPELFSTKGVDFRNMETGQAFEEILPRTVAANVYFGAMPVVAALAHDPDIVICGRVTDTGITVAAMVHEFGWESTDWNKLAHGIVAGHLIECGAQATGGNFTDWKKVGSFHNIGFPIVECYPSGEFVLTKHPGTGGLVTAQTVKEQLLYEMGHPRSYITPDVIADFSTIKLTDEGHDRVRISDVRGYPPTDLLKVSIAFSDGFKCAGTLILCGPDARQKAEKFAEIFWATFESELSLAGLPPVPVRNTEFIGCNSTHGALSPKQEANEILLRFSARSATSEPLKLFRKLLPSLILSGPSGVAVTGGAPAISDVVSYWPALVPQAVAPADVVLIVTQPSGQAALAPAELVIAKNLAWPVTAGDATIKPSLSSAFSFSEEFTNGEKYVLPLWWIAHARSGDKGDTSNIGLIARSEIAFHWILSLVTESKVKEWFAGICHGKVTRHEVANLWAVNFLLEQSLGGGGTQSLFIDAQGKTFSQALLRCKIPVPLVVLQSIEPQNRCPQGLLTEQYPVELKKFLWEGADL